MFAAQMAELPCAQIDALRHRCSSAVDPSFPVFLFTVEVLGLGFGTSDVPASSALLTEAGCRWLKLPLMKGANGRSGHFGVRKLGCLRRLRRRDQCVRPAVPKGFSPWVLSCTVSSSRFAFEQLMIGRGHASNGSPRRPQIWVM